jgi:hypothetical protein
VIDPPHGEGAAPEAARAQLATAAFARALLRHLVRARAALPSPELGPALAAIDAFVAAPKPVTFLAASRALGQARRAHALRHLHGTHADRSFRRGLEAVRAVPGLDDAHSQLLARLPVDARTGRRLLALAQLLEVHVELSGRAAAQARALRRKLAAPRPPRPSGPPSWRGPDPDTSES